MFILEFWNLILVNYNIIIDRIRKTSIYKFNLIKTNNEICIYGIHTNICISRNFFDILETRKQFIPNYINFNPIQFSRTI